jgi:hypothetical protein
VIPAGVERARFAVGAFHLVRFAEFPPLVCVPGDTATLILEGPTHVDAYQAILDELDKAALSEQHSTDLITGLATGRDTHAPGQAGRGLGWPDITEPAEAGRPAPEARREVW